MVRPVSYRDYGFRPIKHANGLTGLAVRLINGTGQPSVLGSVVAISPAADNCFILQTNEFDAIGVVAESGRATGQVTWVIISGVAKVLFKNGVAPVRGNVALSADTDGRATYIAVPSANPIQAEHFKEIGHVMESKQAGTNIIANVLIHFN